MTLQEKRWKEMGRRGAFVLDTDRGLVPVKTASDAETFFRGMCDFYKPGDILDHESADHAWLEWLIRGYYRFYALCPAGAAWFTIHRNNEIGHHGSGTGFSVSGHGCHNRPIPFSFRKALRGSPRTEREKLLVNLEFDLQNPLSSWWGTVFQSGARCPVFGDELTTGNACVGYDKPFEEYVLDFFDELRVEPTIDEKLTPLWLAFHARNMRPCLMSLAGRHELGLRYRLRGDVFEGLRS